MKFSALGSRVRNSTNNVIYMIMYMCPFTGVPHLGMVTEMSVQLYWIDFSCVILCFLFFRTTVVPLFTFDPIHEIWYSTLSFWLLPCSMLVRLARTMKNLCQ